MKDLRDKMDILAHEGEGYKALFDSADGWRIALLRYGPRFAAYTELERHRETDEVFVLLCGSATLIVEDEPIVMEKNTVYNIRRGVWHAILVSRDAAVLIAENANTTKENSDHIPLDVYRRGESHADK